MGFAGWPCGKGRHLAVTLSSNVFARVVLDAEASPGDYGVECVTDYYTASYAIFQPAGNARNESDPPFAPSRGNRDRFAYVKYIRTSSTLHLYPPLKVG